MTRLYSNIFEGWAAIRSLKYDGIATVYGEPYHQISPIISSGEWNQMISWCIETFGPSGTEKSPGVWSPNEIWYANNAKFLFRDQKDLTLFMLRWS